MKVENFIEIIGSDFFVGVPDSQLKALCDYLMEHYGIEPTHHIIAANEGNAAALAAGYHLATSRVPVVYLQNSGEGNIMNPVVSLLNQEVYAIPAVFIIGWRGEPGVHDEPQHVYQGKVTTQFLVDMDIPYFIIDKETRESAVADKMKEFRLLLADGKQVAFVIKKGALNYGKKRQYQNDFTLQREEIIEHITAYSKGDVIVSTTGKASRELFEVRERNSESHEKDFLTVGSMGHSSSIALGIAVHRPNAKVWCIDGDGALLMHMGAMTVIGNISPSNLVHVVINNSAHDSVGGMPTVADKIKLTDIARGCGYQHVSSVSTAAELDNVLEKVSGYRGLVFIEVKASIGAREDLGRPTIGTTENKDAFMSYLQSLSR